MKVGIILDRWVVSQVVGRKTKQGAEFMEDGKRLIHYDQLLLGLALGG